MQVAKWDVYTMIELVGPSGIWEKIMFSKSLQSSHAQVWIKALFKKLWFLPPRKFYFDWGVGVTVMSQLKKKKKKGNVLIFWDHTCPTYHITSPPLVFNPPYSLLTGSSIPCSLFYFLLFSQILFSSLSHTLPLVPPYHHLHHYFSGNVTGKSLGTSKHLHPFYLR